MYLLLFLGTSVLLLIIGLYGLIVRREMLRMMIALEIMIHSGNLNLIAFALSNGLVDAIGESSVIVLISIEACTLAVMMAVMLNLYRVYGSLDVSKLKRLRW